MLTLFDRLYRFDHPDPRKDRTVDAPRPLFGRVLESELDRIHVEFLAQFIDDRFDGKGRVARCHLRDASWFQWPLLETAVEGNIVADFPLCNKSFNCSYSGHDL